MGTALLELIVAAVIFTGGHFLLSSRPLRRPLVAAMGEKPFLGLYSLIALAALAWMAWAYGRAPTVVLWSAPAWSGGLALVLVLLAAIFFVAGMRPDNPTAVGGRPGAIALERLGFFAVTRQPMLWGFSLWALGHIPANGDLASLILFGAILLLALPGGFVIDAHLRRDDPEGFARLAEHTSNLPFAAIAAGRARLRPRALAVPVAGGAVLYLVLLFAHPWLFGAAPLG